MRLKLTKLSCLIIFLCITRVVLYFYYNAPTLILQEAAQFDSRALELATNGHLTFAAAWGSFYLPLGLVYKVLQLLGAIEVRVFVVFLLNTIAAAISLMLLVKITNKLFPQRPRLSQLVGLSFVLFYPLAYLGILIMPENFLIPILLFLFYKLLSPKLSNKEVILVSIALAAAIILRPQFLLVAPFIVGYLSIKQGRALRLFLPLIVVVGATIFANKLVDPTAGFTLSTNGGMNFVLTWCQPRRAISADGYWFSPPVFHGASPETDLMLEANLADTASQIKAGIDCVLKNPARVVTNVLNVRNLFDSAMQPNLLTTFPLHNLLLALSNYLIVAIVFLFLICPLIFGKQNRFAWVMITFLLGTLALTAYGFNPGEERYLLPYIPLMLPFALMVVVHFGKIIVSKLSKVPANKLVMLWLVVLLIGAVPILFVARGIGLKAANYASPLQFYEPVSVQEISDRFVALNQFIARVTIPAPVGQTNDYAKILKQAIVCLDSQPETECIDESVRVVVDKIWQGQRTTSDYDFILGSLDKLEISRAAEFEILSLLIELEGKSKDAQLILKLQRIYEFGLFNLANLQFEYGEFKGAFRDNRKSNAVSLDTTLAAYNLLSKLYQAKIID